MVCFWWEGKKRERNGRNEMGGRIEGMRSIIVVKIGDEA